MIKSIAAVGFALGLAASAALAQTAPPMAPAAPAPAEAQPMKPAEAAPAGALSVASADDCMKVASDLANSAEQKKLADDKLDRIDDLLTKMETHCDAKQFGEASAVARDIKSVIETQ